jgi:acid phosphatase family membrane protein YuiD
MAQLEQLLNNDMLRVAIISWIVAQVLKVFVSLIYEKKLDLSRVLASGGMPSSHTAFVMALTVSIGQTQGYETPLFATVAVLSFIVMYDAANVRLEAGKQAAILNKLIETLEDPTLNAEKKLKELLGHTPLQVLAGAILGIGIALLFYR